MARITLDQMITNTRPIGLCIDEFNLLDAEHIASIPSRENRAKALEQIHPDRREHVKSLVIELFNARKSRA